jgi:hypothetical protein
MVPKIRVSILLLLPKEGFRMLVNIENPRFYEQFHTIWQALSPTIREELERKIAFITDNNLSSNQEPHLIPQSRVGKTARLAYTDYFKWAELYAIVFYEPAFLLTDAGLRGAIACQLASVLQEGRKWLLEVDETLSGGGSLDPWIPEVMGECHSLDDFWEWLEDTVQVEAEMTVRDWNLQAVIPDHALTKIRYDERHVLNLVKPSESRKPFPFKNSLRVLFSPAGMPVAL